MADNGTKKKYKRMKYHKHTNNNAGEREKNGYQIVLCQIQWPSERWWSNWNFIRNVLCAQTVSDLFSFAKIIHRTQKTCAKYRSKINKNNGRCALKRLFCILFHYIDWLGYSSPPFSFQSFVFVALFSCGKCKIQCMEIFICIDSSRFGTIKAEKFKSCFFVHCTNGRKESKSWRGK